MPAAVYLSADGSGARVVLTDATGLVISNLGTGTVSSVGLTGDGVLHTVTGSPVTTTGSMALALATQTANTVLAGPASGGAVAPTMRALVAADLPAIPFSSLTSKPTTASGYALVLVSGDIPALAESGITNLTTDLAAKAPLASPTFTGTATAPAVIASGLTGATAASRYVGATTGGAPTSGTFAVGDIVIDQTGRIFVCTTAGTPGLWVSVLTTPGSSIVYAEDFIGGNTVGSSVGTHGWTVPNGTNALVVGEANHIGIFQKQTGATSGTVAQIASRSTPTTSLLLPSATFETLWIMRLNTNDVNTTCRTGLMADPSASPSTDGIYVEKLDADTNWFFVCRAASTQTRTDSTVAVTTGWIVFLIRRKDASTIGFRIGSTVAAAMAATEITMTTNIPTVGVAWCSHIVNSTTTSKTVDYDYTHLAISGMSR